MFDRLLDGTFDETFRRPGSMPTAALLSAVPAFTGPDLLLSVLLHDRHHVFGTFMARSQVRLQRVRSAVLFRVAGASVLRVGAHLGAIPRPLNGKLSAESVPMHHSAQRPGEKKC